MTATATEKRRLILDAAVPVFKIRDAYAQIAAIVAAAQRSGDFRAQITPQFAAQAFYGAVEQVLTGWIFDAAPVGDPEFERAKTMVVELICDGLGAPGAISSGKSD